MSDYGTTPEGFAAYVAGRDDASQLTADEAVVQATLDHSQRIVEALLQPRPAPLTAGPLIPDSELTARQRLALQRAVYAQAEHELTVGLDVISVPHDGTAGVGDLRLSQVPAPTVGAKVRWELAGHGLLRRSGCAEPEPEPVEVL